MIVQIFIVEIINIINIEISFSMTDVHSLIFIFLYIPIVLIIKMTTIVINTIYLNPVFNIKSSTVSIRQLISIPFLPCVP